MPPHLQLTLLNVPQQDAASSLPRPQHVVLNHLYCQRHTSGVNALIVGTTHRYKTKYVTTVMYKPRRRCRTAVDIGLQQHTRLPQQQLEQQPVAQLGGPQYASTSPRPIPARTTN